MEDDVRIRLAALIAGAALMAGCNSEPTAPDGREAADAAAATLLHLADSLSANGGNASEVGAYRGLASLLMGTGRLSTVSIDVDGTASEYLATAQEIDANACPPGAVCAAVLRAPIRSIVAWEKSNPRRAVQLFTVDFSGEPWLDQAASGGSLVYLDGAGSMYGGTSTSHDVSVKLSDTPCPKPDERMLAIWSTAPCRQAEFGVSCEGTLTLIPIEEMLPDSLRGTSVPANPAPSHHLTMTSQQVHGTHLDLAGLCIDSCSNPPGTTPPVQVPWRDSLTATLTASVGSDVTFTFTVKNPTAYPTVMKFNDAQQYDIRVWDANNALVWRWGPDKGFTQALVTRTLAPGESATYVEHWTPPASGSYRAMAYLTSSTHAAVGFANFSAP
jgi:hypothetical protein